MIKLPITAHRPLTLLIWIWGLLCYAPLSAAIQVTDDLGNTLVLEQPAQRIIALTPHATELLFAAGLGERVVGVPSYSDYPEAAQAIPRIGGYNAVDLERILALRPDLVVGWHSGNNPRILQQLRDLGLTVYSTEPTHIGHIAHTLEQLGRLGGTEAIAQTEAARFRTTLAELEHRYRHQPPVTVFYQVWHQPLITVGNSDLIHQVIELCGGRNIFAALDTANPRISEEAVLQADPQAIVASGMGTPRPEWLDNWRRWPQLQAVARQHLFFILPDIIQRPTPRLLDGASQLCEALQRVREAQIP